MKIRDSWVVGRGSKFLFAVLAAVLLAGGALAVRAQAPDTAPLRAQLAERYNIVPLQNGLALTPLKPGGSVRLIEIKDGVISLNGDVVSARDLRQRLGGDADLLLRVTYLDAAAVQGLAAPAALPAPAAPPGERGDDDRDERRSDSDGRRAEIRRGDIVRFGGSVTVAENESVEGDVVTLGGSADIDGEIVGELTVVGGSADLGPKAHVHGDVTVVGGSLTRAPGAQIDGKTEEVGSGDGRWAGGSWNGNVRPWSRAFSSIGTLVATLVRVGLLALVMLLVTAIGGRHVESIASRTVTDPLRSGLTGLLAEVLSLPLLVLTCLVLIISILGIPLLLLVPFMIVFALILALVGFTGVAYQVGNVVATRFGVQRGMYLQVMLGLAAIVAVTVFARLVGLLDGFMGGFVNGLLTVVGYMVEFVAWTVGIGAIVLTWLNMRRSRSTPGQAPAAAVPVNAEGLR